MKILNLTIKLLAISLAIVFTSCSDDEDPIPVVSFDSSSYTLAENATSPLQVKVKLDIPAPIPTTVNYSVAGTAVEGEDYAEIADKKVTFNQGESEAVIFINPVNVSLIEDDKTIVLTLSSGEFYNLDQSGNSTTITLLDNKTAAADAPEVAFTTTSVVTNAYMQETIEINVGISEALTGDVNIPISFGGEAIEGTNYTIEGLTENNELLLNQGELSAKFSIIIKNTEEIDIDKNIVIGFSDPVVTDYAVSASNSSANINIIDPVVQNVWFLDKESYTDRTGNESIVIGTEANGDKAYTDEGRPFSVVCEGVYAPYVQRQEEDGTWTNASAFAQVYADNSNSNIWKGDWSFTYRNVPAPEKDSYIYYYTYASNIYDIKDFFPSNYIVGYSAAWCKLDQYLRFVADDKTAKTGKVFVPEQSITCYRAKDGYEWKGKTLVSETYGEQYNYRLDSNETEGDLSKSSNVVPFTVNVSGEGTFDVDNKIIYVTVKFSSDDTNLTANEVNFRIYPLRDDEPAE